MIELMVIIFITATDVEIEVLSPSIRKCYGVEPTTSRFRLATCHDQYCIKQSFFASFPLSTKSHNFISSGISQFEFTNL